MRVATFNILHGAVPGEEAVDAARLAEAVATLDVDLLGLQEVDRNQPRSGHADLTVVAAEAMAAQDHQFVAALAGTPDALWTAATGAEEPDEAAYGVALLSRHPVSGWTAVRLPPAPVPVPHRFHGRRLPRLVSDEARVAVVADVDTPEGPLRVVTTHLSFLTSWNGVQLRRLCRSVATDDRPLVLMGDLNMGPGRAARITGMTPLAAGPTFPAEHPAHQLDHLLGDGRVAACASDVLRLPVSDHRALVADISLRDPA